MCQRGNKKTPHKGNGSAGGGHRLLSLLTGFSLLLLVSLSLLVAWDGPATHSGFSCRPSFHLFVTLLDSLINWCHTWPWEMSDPIMLNRLYFFGTTVQSPCHVQLSPCETSKGNCLRTQWALDGQQSSQGANLWALKATRVHDLMS